MFAYLHRVDEAVADVSEVHSAYIFGFELVSICVHTALVCREMR
jgi:hypothetical protein